MDVHLGCFIITGGGSSNEIMTGFEIGRSGGENLIKSFFWYPGGCYVGNRTGVGIGVWVGGDSLWCSGRR